MDIKRLFQMKRPCPDCPFLKSGGIELHEGRLEQIKMTYWQTIRDRFSATKQPTQQAEDMTTTGIDIYRQERRRTAPALWLFSTPTDE